MWLPIDQFYWVSSDGHVKSVRYGKERILKPFRIGSYLGVWLGAGNKSYIHRLVAEAFCPKIDDPCLQVDHINRQKHDNSAQNLRWVSASENMKNIGTHTRRGFEITRNGKKILMPATVVRPHAL
jgi:hypothetical protein